MFATSALGAALAFSTAPAMAQDATQQVTPPVTTQQAPATATPTTTTATPPAATTDPAPVATDSAATTETPVQSTTPKATRTASRAAAAAAAARRAQAQSLARTLAARSAARSAPAASAATPAPAPVEEAPPPVVAEAQPAPAPQAAKPTPARPNNTALELGGGALALLALGGAAYAVTRRRKSDEEVWADEGVAYHDEPVAKPVAEPMALETPVEASAVDAATPRHDPVADERSAMLAPPMSAFAWSAEPRHDSTGPAAAGDDRHEGESWVERAQRGPSPDNPSLSLRKRLKRAAFFDQREREVAEGNAVPVDADAGLPENLDEHA